MALAFLLAAAAPASAQECSDSNVRSRGATGNGQQDDAGAFMVMENDAAKGVVYMSGGTYRIANSITLNKPIIGAADAVFQAGPRAARTLQRAAKGGLRPAQLQSSSGEGCV